LCQDRRGSPSMRAISFGGTEEAGFGRLISILVSLWRDANTTYQVTLM
jgi:hypothetical protein